MQVRDKFTGVLNGIDSVEWDPAADPLLPANFSPAQPAGKALCKQYLQVGTSVTPLVSGVTGRRLSSRRFMLSRGHACLWAQVGVMPVSGRHDRTQLPAARVGPVRGSRKAAGGLHHAPGAAEGAPDRHIGDGRLFVARAVYFRLPCKAPVDVNM